MKLLIILPVLFVILNTAQLQANDEAILAGQRAEPVTGKTAMVVTSHQLATEIALEILKEGGNAIDAAIAAGFVLAVTQPRSGNIGGGGFMLYSPSYSDAVTAIDYRETAPSKAHEKMFLDDMGNGDQTLSRFSHLSAGVPGTVAGFALALEKFGTMSLAEVLQPAINLAKNGFVVPNRFVEGIAARKQVFDKWPSSKAKFFKQDGSSYQAGEIFKQPDLAKTLQLIADKGAEGFYTGETARLIESEMQKHGGLISYEDLANYQAVIRQPVHGTYRGFDVYSMSPPSSGGVHIVQILNLLEQYPITEYGHNSAQTIHLMAEAMRRAYADRASYLGDSDFIKVPLKGLISKSYSQAIVKNIKLNRATPSVEIKAGNPQHYESPETTHFSIVDQFGNAVSNTYTLNFSYGSGIVVTGAGFLLNNEMDDFSAKPGATNAYGLMGGEANKIEPNKRMLSSMSPTIVKQAGKNFLITGSPVGSRIISTTLQVIMNVIDHKMNIQTAVNSPRIHHQWWPDEIRIEQGISPDTIKLLTNRGHKMVQKSAMGGSQSILVDQENRRLYGAADPRQSTSKATGF
ncbi:MAG: gamma-glutamyltransferase [Pseudomonadota bacterium]|nr:gamma-glutamyltransferase [Pseudomonadota bacterium]